LRQQDPRDRRRREPNGSGGSKPKKNRRANPSHPRSPPLSADSGGKPALESPGVWGTRGPARSARRLFLALLPGREEVRRRAWALGYRGAPQKVCSTLPRMAAS
jgi:hypothetical protein